MAPDYYAVLGVSPGATFDEIKRAYRARAKLLHPDKAGNDSDSRMQALNEAYDVLKDPQKKLVYDATRMGSGSGVPGVDDVAFDWTKVNSFVNQVMQCVAAMAAAKRQRAAARCKGPGAAAAGAGDTGEATTDAQQDKGGEDERPQPVRVELRATIEELWDPPVKKLAVRVARRGGGEASKPRVCTKHLYVSLMNYQDSYTFEGMGDEGASGLFGDVEVLLVVEHHPVFTIDPLFSRYDLHAECKVTMHDYFYGAEVPLTLPDGSELRIAFEGLLQRGADTGEDGQGCGTSGRRCHIEREAGLPYVDEASGEVRRGDLYVFLEVDLDAVNREALARPEVRSAVEAIVSAP